MKSMTGYGLATATDQNKLVSLEVIVRIVNGRFLEPRFHVPREYFFLESTFKEKLQKFYRRGTVDIYINRRLIGSPPSQIRLHKPFAAAYVQASRKLAQSLQIEDTTDLQALLRVPGVVEFESKSEVTKGEIKVLHKLFETALKQGDQARKREGKALQKELYRWLIYLDKEVSKINILKEKSNEILYEKYKAKIQKKIAGFELDMNRLSQEIVIQIDKADMSEELSRLEEHLQNFGKLLKTPDVEGKKLEFYTQELLREVNTIGSKSNISEVTKAVIECKTIIERLREQVQNVE